MNGSIRRYFRRRTSTVKIVKQTISSTNVDRCRNSFETTETRGDNCYDQARGSQIRWSMHTNFIQASIMVEFNKCRESGVVER